MLLVSNTWMLPLALATARVLAAPQPSPPISADVPMPSRSLVAVPSITPGPSLSNAISPSQGLTSGVADDAAHSCWSAWYSYSLQQQSNDDIPSTPIGVIPTSVETLIGVTNNETVPLTTLCDGWPRDLVYPTTYQVTHYTTLYNVTQYTRSTPANPIPQCTVQNSAADCTSLWNSFDYTYSSLQSNQDTSSWTYDFYDRPPCTSPLRPCPQTDCTVAATDVTMYYWPATVTGDFCGNLTTITPSPTDGSGAPNTIEVGNMTFTSPSVYFVASSAYAWHATSERGLTTWGTQCGKGVEDATVIIDPTDVSTIDPHDKSTTYSMDWNDLNTPRHDAYERGCSVRYRCGELADTIGSPHPFVLMPEEARTKFPEWANCNTEGVLFPTLFALEPPTSTTSVRGANLNGNYIAKPAAATANPLASVSQYIPLSTHTGLYIPSPTDATADSEDGPIQFVILDGYPRSEGGNDATGKR